MSMFYNIVKEYAENFRKQRPDCVSSGNTVFCAILTSKHDVFTGVNAAPTAMTAEQAAIDAMMRTGQKKTRQIISVSLADLSVVVPSKKEITELIEMDDDNIRCEVYTTKDDSLKAVDFIKSGERQESVSDKFSEEFGKGQQNGGSPFADSAKKTQSAKKPEEVEYVDISQLGAPADFSDGFDIDVTNPFYEPAGMDTKEVATIATISEDSAAIAETVAPKKTTPEISKEELLKQAKKRKKIAKAIFGTKRK